ncbi:hypothetical protein TKK_0004075 [Trichogramma kaykai]
MEGQNAPTIDVIVQRILSNWAALRQAVEHGMGSSDKARVFVQWIVDTLNMNDELDALDLQDELFEYMDDQFQTQLEDNSEKEVALLVIQFYKLFKNNDIRGIEMEYNKLPPTLPWILSNRNIRPAARIGNAAEEDSSSDDEDDSNDNENAMEVEDGWEVVARRR